MLSQLREIILNPDTPLAVSTVVYFIVWLGAMAYHHFASIPFFHAHNPLPDDLWCTKHRHLPLTGAAVGWYCSLLGFGCGVAAGVFVQVIARLIA